MTPTAGSYTVLASRRKTEHVDWRKIAALNIDQMYQTFDYNTLQENIYSITFCDIELEVDNKIIDPNYIKLFKLSQLTIEYLLNSQEYLTHQLGSVEERIKKHEQNENELKQQIEKLQKELSKVSKESHKRKKLLMAQQQLIHGVPKNYHKCPHCSKAFLHQSYLQTHLTKRHSDLTVVSATAVNTDGDSSSGHGSGNRSIMPTSDSNNLAFEKELKLLRDQLQAFEERDTQKHNEIANIWKLFHERDLQYEANLKELMKKFSVKQTNLGAICDDVDDEVDAVPQALPKNMSRSVIQESNKKKKSVALAQPANKAVISAAPKESREDLAVFKKETKHSEKLLQKKIQNLEKNFTSHLKEQEKMWRLQMEDLKKKHKEEMLQKSQQKIQQNKKKDPTVTKVAKRKLNFFQKSEKSAIPKKQTLPLEEKASVDTFSFRTSPVKDRDADRVIDMVEEIENIEEDDNNDDDDEEEEDEEDEDEEEEDEDEEDDEDEDEDEERTNDDDHSTQNDLYDSQSYHELMQKMYKQVTENPKILKEMKSEMADLLTEKLEKIGFPANTKAISTKSYQDKISILKKDRVNKAKKYPGFYKERKRLDELVNTIAKKKLQASEKSMKTVKDSKTVAKAPKVHSPQQNIWLNSKKNNSNSNKMPKKQQQQQPKQQQTSHRPVDNFTTRPIISKAEIHSQGVSSSHEPVSSIQKSTATIRSNGPKQKPATSWSESDNSDKEKTDSWTDTDVSSLLNDQHYHTPAKTPAKPARGIALDKTQPSQHVENPKRQPVPLPRKNVSSDFDAEDSSDFDVGNITGHSKKTPNHPTATPMKSTKVAEIGNIIQSQLENRPHVKFPGAVDLMKKPEYTEADDSDFSKISLLDEDINDNKLKNPKYTSTPASRTALDTEVSTNTYSTSKWGSSSKVVSSLSSFDST